MSILAIVRHGQSQWNLENKFTGEVDVPLTAKGKQEATEAGRKLRFIPFDCCFTSELRRAQETLALILKESARPCTKEIRTKAFNERNYGELQGMDKAKTAEKYGARQVEIWRRSFGIAPPGGESLKDTAGRVIPYFTIQVAPLLLKNENILIVAHGNSLRALMMHLEGISASAIEGIDIATGVPKIYTYDSGLRLLETTYL